MSQAEAGQIVVMDSLSFHKVAGVSERIRAAPAELLYLPPYSPDFNPIEKCCSKLKQKLCSLNVRTHDTLERQSLRLSPTSPHKRTGVVQGLCI